MTLNELFFQCFMLRPCADPYPRSRDREHFEQGEPEGWVEDLDQPEGLKACSLRG